MPSMTILNTAKHATYGAYGYTRSGKRVNKSLYDATQTAADNVQWGSVVWTQGGLNAGAVAASAKTHNGLDVGDISVKGKSISQIRAFVTELMKCGVVGFIRGFVDSMPKHLHIILIPANQAHSSCEAQIYDTRYGYKFGGAGLAGAPDANWWGPKRLTMVSWERCNRNPVNLPGVFVVDLAEAKYGIGFDAKGVVRHRTAPGERLAVKQFVWEDLEKGHAVTKYAVDGRGYRYRASWLKRSI